MAETTGNDDFAAAVRDRGMEQLEGAKGQLAEGAERVAAAVERTADELGGDQDNAISGFGHSVASLMRQLAGGLRERDVDEFARELAALARRNPGVFLAGSVALGFGIARFFKARTPRSTATRRDDGWQPGGWAARQSMRGDREFDAEERLDLSANAAQRSDSSQDNASAGSGASQNDSASRDERERNASKSRQSPKPKAKPQRASSGGSQHPSASNEPPKADRAATGGASDSKDTAFSGGAGGGALQGGKS